jgi:hypothetical protein
MTEREIFARLAALEAEVATLKEADARRLTAIVDARLAALAEAARNKKAVARLEAMGEARSSASTPDLPAPPLVGADPKITQEEAQVFWDLIAPHGDKIDKDLRRRYVRDNRRPHRSNALRALRQAGLAEDPVDMDRLLSGEREAAA